MGNTTMLAQMGDSMIGFAAVVCIFGLPLVWVVAYYCHASFKSWQDTSLKRDMVARGYTAQEIIAVVRARKGKKAEQTAITDVPPAKPIKHPAHA
jgi:hypothetical protein